MTTTETRIALVAAGVAGLAALAVMAGQMQVNRAGTDRPLLSRGSTAPSLLPFGGPRRTDERPKPARLDTARPDATQ